MPPYDQSLQLVGMVVRKLEILSDTADSVIGSGSCWGLNDPVDIQIVDEIKFWPQGGTTRKLIECPK